MNNLRALVAIPTIIRSDLLTRNRKFLEGIRSPDEAFILDNGWQSIDIGVPIGRPQKNLGVSGSWNLFMKKAFVDGKFDLLVILQDDIIWDAVRLQAAKHLIANREDVDLFLSDLQFSVQVHRKGNETSIGPYDERYYPAYCEDDDYALLMTSKEKIYERFHELDPMPGSITNGSIGYVNRCSSWEEQHEKLFAKWGKSFGVNIPGKPWYKTNRGINLDSL